MRWEVDLMWWEVDLLGVDLVGVDLVGVDLVGVDLVGVDLVGVDLMGRHHTLIPLLREHCIVLNFRGFLIS